MRVGARGAVHESKADRPGNGDSRRWSRNIGDWRYSFTLVNMPSGEIRWFVTRYDTPISKWADRASYTNEQARLKFGCYWHPYREWTFKPTD
jgi:hypothetical protein